LTTASPDKQAKAIVAMWDAACKDGLGSKKLAPNVKTKFRPRFFKKIKGKLVKGDVFTAADKRATKQVAKDVGRVCAMMTAGPTVSRDTFEEVFRMLKRHAACPNLSGRRRVNILGAGVWCDVPIN
jgi:hypothetical protein